MLQQMYGPGNHQAGHSCTDLQVQPDRSTRAMSMLRLRLPGSRHTLESQHEQRHQKDHIPPSYGRRGIGPAGSVDLPIDLIAELSDHIAPRPVLADEKPGKVSEKGLKLFRQMIYTIA